MTANDRAWETLFDRFDIAGRVQADGFFVISAGQIRAEREPRLMTKLDHVVNLPAPFARHSLAILPISRGEYIISSFDAYHSFEEPHGPISRVWLPGHLQSLASQRLTSESLALNCAAACGVLSDFLEEENPVPTVSGRMGTGCFDFSIHTGAGPRTVAVRHAQMEIDAAYEGERFLSLFEAKCSRSRDFLIRQLYYPFRTWRERVRKPVKTVFFIFTGGQFYLYEYCFADPFCYNSPALVRQKAYALAAGISRADLERLVAATAVLPEPRIPFPQANSFDRVVNLLELLAERPMDGGAVTGQYLFAPRQTGYYTDAGRYLGLVKRSRLTAGGYLYSLTERGARVMSLDLRARRLALAEAILQHGVFNELLRLWLARGHAPDIRTAAQVMRGARLYGVGAESTVERRASSVIRWLEWVMRIVED